MPEKFRYLFGPVPSRRLGYSLGIDLVPFKTCSYDCIYCQLGRTTEKTSERKEYIPTAGIIQELKRKLAGRTKIDYLTFSGSGEPTLHAGLGELVRAAKRLSSIPVAVITNGSLLWREDVRKDLAEADLIVPSLDAGSPELYRHINRPAPDIPYRTMKNGLIDFCSTYREKIWLEVFFINGVNTTDKDAGDINAVVKKINPARVQLNTVQRPPSESHATAVPGDRLRALADLFDGRVELIADFDRPANATGDAGDIRDGIVELLKRRPCTVGDIGCSLNAHRHEVLKSLDELEESGRLKVEARGHDLYYTIDS